MKMLQLTPVLMVDAIEPVLSFWVDRLGFSRKTELQHDDALGFVILERDGIELMYSRRRALAPMYRRWQAHRSAGRSCSSMWRT